MGAVAMSGAAVSPMMGRMGGKVAPFRLLLTLFNIRLGVWVMNPRWPLGEPPSPALAPMATNPRLPPAGRRGVRLDMVDDRWLYLTDGGHLDNLGLVEAVRAAAGQGAGDECEQRPARLLAGRRGGGLGDPRRPRHRPRGSWPGLPGHLDAAEWPATRRP